MTKRYVQMAAWVKPETHAALLKVKDRDGINVSEQVRRAVDAWLRSRGVGARRKAARDA